MTRFDVVPARGAGPAGGGSVTEADPRVTFVVAMDTVEAGILPDGNLVIGGAAIRWSIPWGR